MRHWAPFDERVLVELLDLATEDLEALLYNDHRTIAMVAEQRGFTPDALADRLLEPWTGVSEFQRARLRDHTLRLITQGHLAQHVFFHVLHGTDAWGWARRIFRMSPHRYLHLRRKGLTPLQIAAISGVAPRRVAAGMRRLFLRDRNEGLRRGLSLRAEADLLMRRQRQALPCWLRRPLARFDRGNPYGKEWRHHPVAKPPSARTDAEERHDERVIERIRATLPPSCWRRPAAWSWAARDLVSPWR